MSAEERLLELELLQESLALLLLEADLQTPFIKVLNLLASIMATTLRDTISADSRAHLEAIFNGDTT